MPLVHSLITLLSPLFAAGLFLSAIIISLAVYRDAATRKLTRRPVAILSPVAWAWICLFLNLPALALYWAIHYSTFSRHTA